MLIAVPLLYSICCIERGSIFLVFNTDAVAQLTLCSGLGSWNPSDLSRMADAVMVDGTLSALLETFSNARPTHSSALIHMRAFKVLH